MAIGPTTRHMSQEVGGVARTFWSGEIGDESYAPERLSSNLIGSRTQL